MELLSRLSLRAVIKILAQPKPEGLGVKVPYTSLHRFYSRNARRSARAKYSESTQDFEALEAGIQGAPNPRAPITGDPLDPNLSRNITLYHGIS